MKRSLPNIRAVSPEELLFAHEVGGLAASNRIPNSGVSGMGVDIDMEDGTFNRVELTDVPINRAAIAIRDQFPQGMLMPLMSRLWALYEMVEKPSAAAYVRDIPDRPGELEMSEAMFKVAAVMPLNSDMKFNERTFFRRVATEHAAKPDQGPAAR